MPRSVSQQMKPSSLKGNRGRAATITVVLCLLIFAWFVWPTRYESTNLGSYILGLLPPAVDKSRLAVMYKKKALKDDLGQQYFAKVRVNRFTDVAWLDGGQRGWVRLPKNSTYFDFEIGYEINTLTELGVDWETVWERAIRRGIDHNRATVDSQEAAKGRKEEQRRDRSQKLLWESLEAQAATNPDMYTSAELGISVIKPESWRFAHNEEIADARGNVKLNNAEFAQKMRNADLPVVSIMKYPEGHIGLNPTVQIGVGSKEKYPMVSSPVVHLEQVVAGLKSLDVVDGFTLIQDVQSVYIDSVPTASVVFEYDLQLNTGGSFRVRSTMYITWTRNSSIIIGMTGPASGNDESSSEFGMVLGFLKLRNN